MAALTHHQKKNKNENVHSRHANITKARTYSPFCMREVVLLETRPVKPQYTDNVLHFQGHRAQALSLLATLQLLPFN